jgi:prevent-host-death family protein
MCYKCYMEATPRRRKKGHQVGIRELRQNLSVYLRRVEAGETLEVSDRGRAVALLTPLPSSDSPLDRLVAEGRATAPAGDLLELGLPAGKVSRKLSEALEGVRSDRT